MADTFEIRLGCKICIEFSIDELAPWIYFMRFVWQSDLIKNLIQQLEELEGPRSGNATVHNFADILFIAIAATAADADSWYEVMESAFASEESISLGQLSVDDKKNELDAIPKLLDKRLRSLVEVTRVRYAKKSGKQSTEILERILFSLPYEQ